MKEDQEITEEQRRIIESKRLAALAKCRARAGDAMQNPWKLFKCRKVSPEQNATTKKPSPPPPDPVPKPEKFMARIEICSPDSFSVTPLPIEGFAYPSEAACLEKLSVCLSNVVPSHYTQNHGGGEACVFKLRDYDTVLKCLKNSEGVEYEEIPWTTFNVIERFSHSFVEGRWSPCRDGYLSDEDVDKLMGQLPKSLLDVLLPFQVEGVQFGLRRGGRCLIADEMGLGKTLQAIAIASCFMSEGPILVVCPAILRFSWAEELERWLPFCLPSDIHLVFGHQNNPVRLARCPRVVVISYKMLHHLQKSMSEQKWAVLIVDESHHVRCTKRRSEPGEIQAVLKLAEKVNRIVLLSGTPSLSRPGLLGKDKYDFAKTYCSLSYAKGYQGKVFQDFSKGIRLEELNVLLKQTVMIRRLKEHVLMQLPPIRRQIINLVLEKSDIDSAKAVCGVANGDASTKIDGEDGSLDISDEPDGERNDGGCESSKVHSDQILGIAKEFLCEKGIKFVRIDGQDTSAKDRHLAIQSFQYSKEVKVALVGILAGSSGLDLSAAQNVVFLELPARLCDMQQAESRAHRRGQTNAVNVYIFCAKDTSDESRWRKLNRSLYRVSYTVDGKYDAQQQIEVERVSYLETTEETDRRDNLVLETETSGGASAIELVKFSKSDFSQEMQPDEAFDGTNETANMRHEGKNASDRHSSHEYNFGNKADIICALDMGESMVPNRNVEGNAGRVPSQTSPEGHQKFQMDMVDDRFHVTTVLSDGEPVDQVGLGSSSSIQTNSLRFEVSKYTGRIHLYSCIPGIESRPRPLFENFRPEELETNDSPAQDSKKRAQKFIKDDPRYRHALVAFVNEWNSLRPIEQNKLLNKPLQLPLSIELCCLNEGLNHHKGGLLKGGSKKRTTPLYEISCPLPSKAIWKKVCLVYGKKEKEYAQGWTLDDEPLCKLCQEVCKNKNAKEPEFFEDLFCELECYEEYRSRTSGSYLREGLFQIEHGICTNCHLDCHKLVKNIRPLSCEKREKFIRKEAPQLAKHRNLLDKLVRDATEGNSWHADHIVPVYRGGGECMLENMRTLCVACHANVTAAQCAERRSKRAKAKKQLNLVMANLQNVQDSEQIDAKHKDSDQSKTLEDIDEDELIINVPGSAYNRADIKSSGSEEHRKTSDSSEYGNCNKGEKS